MEGIVNIEKTKEDIERCLKIVKEEINIDLSDELTIDLTKDIMDTALFIGGDFSDENIKGIAVQYKETDAIERFLRKHGVK
ncbi:MAG: hypothetical protein ACK5LC_03180 [Coprobacillaceae bacterium]